jgi:cell division protein YceG involved in septum cleavage
MPNWVAVGAVIGTRQWYYRNLEAPSVNQKSRTFTINRGASLSEIADNLKKLPSTSFPPLSDKKWSMHADLH